MKIPSLASFHQLGIGRSKTLVLIEASLHDSGSRCEVSNHQVKSTAVGAQPDTLWRVRLAAIVHQPDAPAGLLGDWARARGLDVTTLEPADLADPPDPGGFDVIAPLGSDHSVHAPRSAWVAHELAF